jgi:hypothetical protein
LIVAAETTFEFDNQPGVTYHATRDLGGFVTLAISADGGPRVGIGGLLVTQNPPPPEPENLIQEGE